MNKPSLFFLPRWYPNSQDPLLGLFVVHHALALKETYNICVVYVEAGPKPKTVETTNYGGILGFTLTFKESNSFLAPLINPLRFVLAQRKAIKYAESRVGAPDIFHVHVLSRTAVYPLWMKITRSIPYFITEHWSRYLKGNELQFRNPIKKWAARIITAHSNGISAVTQALMDGMNRHKLIHKNSAIIPNTVDIKLFKPSLSNIEPSSTWQFLVVNCFDEPAKNNFGLLRVVKRILTLNPQVQFTWVGNGIDFEKTAAYASSLGLIEPYVKFLGEKSSEELASLYVSCDALLLFSRYETQGIVILEALACGKPVIATRVGGIPEILSPNFGYLVESENEDEMVQKILEFMNRESKQSAYNEAAVDFIEQHFSYSAVNKMFQQFFKAGLS